MCFTLTLSWLYVCLYIFTTGEIQGELHEPAGNLEFHPRPTWTLPPPGSHGCHQRCECHLQFSRRNPYSHVSHEVNHHMKAGETLVWVTITFFTGVGRRCQVPRYMSYDESRDSQRTTHGSWVYHSAIRVLKIKLCGMHLYLLSHPPGPASIEFRSCTWLFKS